MNECGKEVVLLWWRMSSDMRPMPSETVSTANMLLGNMVNSSLRSVPNVVKAKQNSQRMLQPTVKQAAHKMQNNRRML